MPTETQQLATTNRKFGRPTLYDPVFCDAIIEYFSTRYEQRIKTMVNKVDRDSNGNFGKGSLRQEVRIVCGEVPTFEGFAISINVSPQTLLRWQATHEDFCEACARARSYTKEWFVQNGAAGVISPEALKFLGKNLTDMTDRQELTGANGAALNAVQAQPVESLEGVSTENLQQAMELMEQAKRLMVPEETTTGGEA